MPAAISVTSTAKVPAPSSQMDTVQRRFWTNFVHQCSGATPLRPKAPGNNHPISRPSPGSHQHPWQTLPAATPQAWCYQPGPHQQADNSSAKLDPHSHPAVIYKMLHSR